MRYNGGTNNPGSKGTILNGPVELHQLRLEFCKEDHNGVSTAYTMRVQ
jgi:hypothetical protein